MDSCLQFTTTSCNFQAEYRLNEGPNERNTLNRKYDVIPKLTPAVMGRLEGILKNKPGALRRKFDSFFASITALPMRKRRSAVLWSVPG